MDQSYTSSESSDFDDATFVTAIPRDLNESSSSSESSVIPQDVGISYWQIFQWPNVFIVGWTPSEKSSSSESSGSSSSLSTGVFASSYFASGFTLFAANGCYGQMGAWENERPVYSNGTYWLKHGDDHFPRWYLQEIETLLIHYVSEASVTPTNNNNAYTPFLFWLGEGGTLVENCWEDNSSLSSAESTTSISALSGSQLSELSSFLSFSSESSVSESLLSSDISQSSALSHSSSSYVDNFPVDLASFVSTCHGMSSIINPATGQNVGMIIDGCFQENILSEDDYMIYKGGLRKTVSNMGTIRCEDASNLFSMSYGMVSITLNLPFSITDGIYLPLAGRSDSASPDMIIFVVNPGESYFSAPGLYAALTPSGIEFSVWSNGNKITVFDSITNVPSNSDITLSFAWDHARRMIINEERVAVAIFVDGLPTAASQGPIFSGDFDNLFQFEIESDESLESWAVASFYIADSPSGKNGLIDITIRRIEIYKQPYGVPMVDNPDIVVFEPYPASKSAVELNFSVIGDKWVNVNVNEPQFRPTISETVNLLDVDTGLSYSQYGSDLGKSEENSYPEIPIGLPIGIKEVKGK